MKEFSREESVATGASEFMAEYRLYVDESGSFRSRGRRSVVCGVLESCGGQVPWGEIRAGMAATLPGLPYPFHATELSEPSAWAVAALLAERSGAARVPGLERVMAETAPARRLVSGAAGASLPSVVLGAVAAGRLPDKGTLIWFNSWLRSRSRSAFCRLEQLRNDRLDGVARYLRQALAPHREHLVAVAAVADPKAPAPPGAAGPSRTASVEGGFTGGSPESVRRDAYVRGLEALLERVFCLLRGDGDCRVQAWVASRNVDLRGYGTLRLTRDAVHEVVELARRFPALPLPKSPGPAGPAGPKDLQVTSAAGLVHYDAGAPMGLVLADFVSNRLFQEVALGSSSAHSLSEQLRRRVGLRLMMGPRHPYAGEELPTIAWDGPARGALRRVFRGQGAETQDLRPAANRTQAECWAGLAAHVLEMVVA